MLDEIEATGNFDEVKTKLKYVNIKKKKLYI